MESVVGIGRTQLLHNAQHDTEEIIISSILILHTGIIPNQNTKKSGISTGLNDLMMNAQYDSVKYSEMNRNAQNDTHYNTTARLTGASYDKTIAVILFCFTFPQNAAL